MGNKESRSAGGGDGGAAVARFIADSEDDAGEKQKPIRPVHLEIFGTPYSGKRTLCRAISTAESFLYDEQPEEVQKLLRRQVQFTAASAALLATSGLSENPEEREDLQKIVDCGMHNVVSDDEQYKAMMECAKRFLKNGTLRKKIDSVQSGDTPVCNAPFFDSSELKKIFSSSFVPSRRQLLSIAAPDSDLTQPEHLKSSVHFYPLEFVPLLFFFFLVFYSNMSFIIFFVFYFDQNHSSSLKGSCSNSKTSKVPVLCHLYCFTYGVVRVYGWI